MTATEQVILVDFTDNPIGTAEKIYAHQHNLCHRAFSVFILRENPPTSQKTLGNPLFQRGLNHNLEILLQQRASNKYHSPNLWTNTCCSHPRPGEDTLLAAKRRLKEEMNIATELQSLGWFHYTAHFDNNLTENEIDHVYIGFIDANQPIHPNPTEIQNYRWITFAQLKKELSQHPKQFTPWLEQAFKRVENHFSNLP
jgi:isopentenyl-diphosphate delta-isomerase